MRYARAATYVVGAPPLLSLSPMLAFICRVDVRLPLFSLLFCRVSHIFAAQAGKGDDGAVFRSFVLRSTGLPRLIMKKENEREFATSTDNELHLITN